MLVKRYITTGISSSDYIEITDGLSEQDTVVTSAMMDTELTEGMEVTDMSQLKKPLLSAPNSGFGRTRYMSKIWEYIKIALMNIRSNKGRSFLTMLGIIIGISSVILIVSTGPA